MGADTYHASVAIGHYTRTLQALTSGEPGSRGHRVKLHSVVVLHALWLLVDPLAHDPVVSVDLPDFHGIVSTPARLRQLVAELVGVGAIERVAGIDRRFRLRKPAVADLDAPARVMLESQRHAAAQAARLVSSPSVAPNPTTKGERNDVLARLGKKPSDIRDALALVAGVAPGTLRYSGAGSGPVQAAIAWLARGGTWAEFVAVCQHVMQDRDRPTTDLVWLFGEQHRGYLQRVVNGLVSGETEPASVDAAAGVSTLPSDDEHRPLAEQVAELLVAPLADVLPIVAAARRSGVLAREVLAETRTFVAGGPRPDWMPA